MSWFNFLDYTHFLAVVLSRALIIGVKYGYFSDEHLYIIENFSFRDKQFLLRDLLATVAGERIYDKVRERIRSGIRRADTDPTSFTLYTYKDQCKYLIYDYDFMKKRVNDWRV